MWRVIYIAPSQEAAERIRGVLEREGILVRLSATRMAAPTGASSVEVMVPSGEVTEAHEILTQALGRAFFRG